ncbi:hypothetical protein [Neobacillus sedimentimangrovi]|jgi:hypothetical protein|uniref:hypothetical protein n=1 Tax=Neobacillus sedimentimangrovi TaxID=2699460 RepID=UPI0004F5E065|nr:hypothetical protein [Neobacillus sedimentimangrovi]AIM16292.1 hypothetical protein HW35_08445 [Bacillus sp. X1(2014)]
MNVYIRQKRNNFSYYQKQPQIPVCLTYFLSKEVLSLVMEPELINETMDEFYLFQTFVERVPAKIVI